MEIDLPALLLFHKYKRQNIQTHTKLKPSKKPLEQSFFFTALTRYSKQSHVTRFERLLLRPLFAQWSIYRGREGGGGVSNGSHEYEESKKSRDFYTCAYWLGLLRSFGIFMVRFVSLATDLRCESIFASYSWIIGSTCKRYTCFFMGLFAPGEFLQ